MARRSVVAFTLACCGFSVSASEHVGNAALEFAGNVFAALWAEQAQMKREDGSQRGEDVFGVFAFVILDCSFNSVAEVIDAFAVDAVGHSVASCCWTGQPSSPI